MNWKERHAECRRRALARCDEERTDTMPALAVNAPPSAEKVLEDLLEQFPPQAREPLTAAFTMGRAYELASMAYRSHVCLDELLTDRRSDWPDALIGGNAGGFRI